MSIKHVTKIFEALLEDNVKKAEAMLKASMETSFKSMAKKPIIEAHKPGDRVQVNMGVDHGKKATVIDKRHIKTDGRGVPDLGRGHYHPLKHDDVAIKYDTGEHDVHRPIHLSRVNDEVKESVEQMECPECNGSGEHEDLESAKNNDLPVECSYCAGSGYVNKVKESHLSVKEAKHPNEVDNLHGRAPPCAKCGSHRDANIHLKHDYKDYHKYEEPKKDVKESENEYEPQTYSYYVGHSKGNRTIFPHPKGQIPTQDTHPEHDEGIAGPYKTKKEAFAAAQGRSKVKESDEIKSDILTELKRSTLASYIKKAAHDTTEAGWLDGHASGHGSIPNKEEAHKALRKQIKRKSGISKAVDKLHNKHYPEDVKESDEINESKIWVGLKKGESHKREVFKHHITPTEQSHGHLYGAVIGPFKTHKAAKLTADTGGNNPHIQHVNDAERITKSMKESDEIKQDVLNELKASTLGNYIKKAASDAADNAHLAAHVTGDSRAHTRKEIVAREEKRHKGIEKATKKLVKKVKE